MFKISHVLQSVRDRGIALWYENRAANHYAFGVMITLLEP